MNVSERVCCLRDHQNNPPEKTGDHGELVSSIGHFYAPDSSFHLYLAADGVDGTGPIGIPQMALARAVNAAIDHNIDILNLSAGLPRPNCTHNRTRAGCAYCSEVQRAVDHGITVVAAAGNNPDTCVHCPSNAASAISVGGVEFECTYNMPRVSQNPTNNPPLAYWTRLWSGYDEYPDNATDMAYCTTRDCWWEGRNCSEYSRVTEWEQNPLPSGGKPDILSPNHFAAKYDDQYPFVWAASSFAAPVVSGCLAGILSTLGSSPSPYEIQQAVRDSSTPLESSTPGIFDAAETRTLLSE